MALEMYAQYQHLTFAYRGRVLTVTMNRPEVKNAANVRMHNELSTVFADVARDPDCDVIVLTGAGDAFSSGGDIRAMQEKIDDHTKWVDTVNEARSLFYGMLDLDKPLIARVNGAATGLGATLAVYADIAIAAESAVKYASKRFGIPAVIARLDVPYGPGHGWPQMMVTLAQMGIPTTISADAPNTHCFLHDRDIFGSLPYLLEQAAVPAPIYNWCAPELVSIEEWTAELTKLTGVEIPLVVSEQCIPPNPVDPSKLLGLGWTPTVEWREGFREMAQNCFPDLFKG